MISFFNGISFLLGALRGDTGLAGVMLFLRTAFHVCVTNISSHKVTFQAAGISLINLSAEVGILPDR